MKTVSTPSQLQLSTVRDKLWPPQQQAQTLQVRMHDCNQFCVTVFYYTGPGASPRNIRSTITAISITLMWDRLSCVDRNGEITGYRILYGTTTPLDQTEMITGTSSSDRTFTASGLVPLTTYMFRIAAVNSDGVGPYSDMESITTATQSTYHR